MIISIRTTITRVYRWLISDNYTPNSRIWSYGAGHPIVPPLGQRTLPRRRPAWCLIDPRTPRPRFWTRIGPCEGSKQPKIGMEYKFSIFMCIHINTYDVFKRCKSNIYIYTHCEGSWSHDITCDMWICLSALRWTTKFMIIYGHQKRKIWCFRVFFFPSKCQITPDLLPTTVIFSKFHGPLWLMLPGPGWWWNTPVDEGMRYLRYLWSVGVWVTYLLHQICDLNLPPSIIMMMMIIIIIISCQVNELR